MTMDAIALAKSEFYLCLSRAFTTPKDAAFLDRLRDDLPADLDDLGARIGYPVQSALADFHAAIANIPTAEQLLVLYSRLFLVPGAPHPSLNTGVYLDGALGGGSLTRLEQAMARCGLERRSDFHDLADHPSAQLELVAWLFAAHAKPGSNPPISATHILSQFVARWMGPLRAELENASAHFALSANPYLHLALVLETAVRHELGADFARPESDSVIDPDIARLREQYAGRALNDKDLTIIRDRLAAAGLPSDHVTIPLDARDRQLGLTAKQPPVPRSAALGTLLLSRCQCLPRRSARQDR